MIPSRSFLLGSLHSLLFFKGSRRIWGLFFYSSPRDSSNLMPALFCLPRFYCVTFLHFLFGYKMSYAIFILFLCSFLGYVMHDYLFTDFYQFLAWKFQYSLACFGFCQCWRWRLCGFCDSIVSLNWDLGTMVERERGQYSNT